tara:strand:- start:5228 stop:5416 length:189 start_codon:yes stop_codon:yes gene_type:complete
MNYPKTIAAFMLSTATFAGAAFAQDIESIPREDTFAITWPDFAKVWSKALRQATPTRKYFGH